MSGKYFVMGATSLVGRTVADLLQAQGCEVVCATRHPCGCGETCFDLCAPQSWEPALRGVRTAMVLARAGDVDMCACTPAFIDAMRRAGVRRVVVLSTLGAHLRPRSASRRLEKMVELSGLRWVHVRPNFFMQALALPPLSTEIAMRGTLSLPLGDAAIAYIDARDVAAALHRALVDEALDGCAITASGPEPLRHAQIAQAIARATGAPVRHVLLDDAAAFDRLLSQGLTRAQVRRVMAFHRRVRAGFCQVADRDLETLLGRPLVTWREFVRAHKAAWTPLAAA